MIDVDSEQTTFSTKFLVGSLVFYLASGAIAYLPEPLLSIGAVLFLAFWFGQPIALFYDRRTVREHTEWTPSKLYYLGFLPGYLGIGVLLLYFHRRGKAFGEGGLFEQKNRQSAENESNEETEDELESETPIDESD